MQTLHQNPEIMDMPLSEGPIALTPDQIVSVAAGTVASVSSISGGGSVHGGMWDSVGGIGRS